MTTLKERRLNAIDKPDNPQNYYGMSVSISNLPLGSGIYLGSNQHAEKLYVKDISFHEEMLYVTVNDNKLKEHTIRFSLNARVGICTTNYN